MRTVHLARRFPDIDLRAYVQDLSRRVFFWADPAKATVSKAREYAQVAQATLVFDTAALLRDHAERIELCRVNSERS